MSSPRERIDLGLAIACKNAVRGVPMTQEEIAVFCGCTQANIYQIELKAKQILAKKLRIQGVVRR